MLQRHISVVVAGALVLVMALPGALSGCGQKGPLTLPKSAAPAASAPAPR